MKLKSLLLSGLLLLVAMTVSAQVTTSSMGGRVTDADDAPIVGTVVVAIHTPTGTTYQGLTDTEGNYRLRNLRPGGPYKVTFTYLGYTTVEHNNVHLVVADSRALDTKMSADATMIDDIVVMADTYSATGNAGSVTEITTRDIDLLPTTSRSIGGLLSLTPQANGQSIAGGNDRQNYITIDGGSFNNMFGIGNAIPGGGTPISLDAVELMSVSITPYDVRQSGFNGAAINAVTRSGTNEFSGSAYTYYRDETFSGLKVGDQKLQRGSASQEKIFGARLGGPIIKDKLFFFASFEYEPRTQPGPTRKTSTDGAANSEQNIARPTDSDMQMISDYLRDNYGYETGPWSGYSYDIPTTRLMGRVDWNISNNHKLMVRYSNYSSKTASNPSTSVSGPAGWSNNLLYPKGGNRQDLSAMWFKNSGYFTDNIYRSIAAELNSSFADNRVFNTFRFTYTFQDETRSTEGGQLPTVDILKDGAVYTTFGTELFSMGNMRRVNQFTLSDDVNWTMGRHNMTAGFQFEHSEIKNGFMRMAPSFYVFDSWEDFVGGQNPSAYAITYSTADGYAQQFPGFGFNQYSLYLQDELALSDRFDLTAGIRFDLPTYPATDQLQTQPIVKDLVFNGIDGKGIKYDTAQMPKERIMFSPRVGFNWDINGDQSWILRGGSGLFTGRIPFVWICSQSGDAGMLQGTMGVTGKENTPGPFNPDRLTYLPSTPPSAGETINMANFTVTDPDFKMPQTWKTSLAVDVKLPWGLKGTLEGLYNKDVNPFYVFKDGLSDPGKMNVSGYGDHRNIYDGTFQIPVNSQTDEGSLGVLPDPNGKDGGLTPFVISNAKFKDGGYYASLTAKIEKPFSNGFSGMIAYTHAWGKNVHDGGGDQVSSVWSGRATINGGNSFERGFSGGVSPNNVVASFSYSVEYAKFMGTTVSLLYRGGNGGRFSYTYNGNIVGDAGANNLMYIPKDGSEIQFSDVMYDSDGDKTLDKLLWSAQQQEDAFFAYIDQDKYLKTRKGKYAERNGAVRPWESQFDVKILQDFFIKTKSGKKNTLQLSIDIMNAANLLNKNWGGAKSTVQPAFLNVTNAKDVSTKGAAPIFQMRPTTGTANAKSEMVTKTFQNSFSFSDTYSFQIGLRYIFN